MGIRASLYYRHSAAKYKLMGMWTAFYDAYQDKTAEKKAFLPLEKTGARILLIAGGADEAWPAEYSVNAIRTYLENKHYEKEVRAIVYPNVSHLTGMMPNREREKKLYRLIPVIGFLYKSFGKYKKECMKAFEDCEKEIIGWLQL